MTPGKGRGPSTGASRHQGNPAQKKLVTGSISVTRKGVGYLPFEASAKEGVSALQDIEVAPEHLGGALNRDIVSVELTGLFPRPKGVVKKVEERSRSEFVCVLKKQGAVWSATPDDARMYRTFKLLSVPDDAQVGMKVLVKLEAFDGKADPTGSVTQIIGTAGDHRTEMNAIVLEHGFATSFPDDVAREAKEIERNYAHTIESEAKNRSDFRDRTTFTIDPADAKDYDDALSIRDLGGHIFEIGIHIADVSFFVRPGTRLDDEAVKRGTSVYLVDATIPMLPHELSGNVCSLKQDEDRLAFSAIFHITSSGQVLERKFERTIIRSNKRFVYEEAQEILDKQDGPYLTELNHLRTIARILKKGREREGAIDFGDNEVRFVLDEEGKPLKVVRKERIETNSLIEEFMLLANREVAKYISKLSNQAQEAPIFLYRIHDEPKADRIDDLGTFVRALGYDFSHSAKAPRDASHSGATHTPKKKISARDIASLLKQIEGKPEEHLIRTATLRSMAKAIYSTKNIGHFGLAFEYYTHFTSPIRRYPDLLVHRIVASHLDGHPLTSREFGGLERMCLNASAQEAKAVEAERDSIRYKQVEYMLDKVGREFDCIISGVTDWGIYVEDEESSAEGLVRVRSLGSDFFTHDQKKYALVGERTKKRFTLGDRVRVKLVAADLSARTLDFELA